MIEPVFCQQCHCIYAGDIHRQEWQKELCEDCRTNLERDVYEPRNYDELERRHRELRLGCNEAVNQALEIAEMLTILPDEQALFGQHIRALRQIRAALDRDRDGTL